MHFKLKLPKQLKQQRTRLDCTFFNHPYIVFQNLIIEDRAVNATFDAIKAIRESYPDDTYISDMLSLIYTNGAKKKDWIYWYLLEET